MYRYKYLILLLVVALFNCTEEGKTDSKDESIPTPVKSSIISVTSTGELTASSLKTIAKAFGQDEISENIRYDVKSYKLIYETTYKGNTIQASGLLFIPKGLTEKAPLLSLQHGTTFVKNDAPSVTGQVTGVEVFAASGFISIVPDFIGYGASSQIFHPYYDQKHSALAVIDMIKATKEYLQKEKIPFNDKLFLAGYSEGGYVTLAAAKEIENDPSYNLSVTAAAAGAGGYDLSDMLSGITTNKTYTYPAYLAFVLGSYNATYDWNKSYSYFFKEKYAQVLDSMLNGMYDGGEINSLLSTNVQELFNDDFYSNLKKPEGELQLKEAISKNSVDGWNSKIPIKLYHGTKDEIIPYQNSEKTLENFKRLGSSNVELILIPGGGHGSSFVPMLKSFIPWFESLK